MIPEHRRWTEAGRLYREKVRKLNQDMQRYFEESLFSDKKCQHESMHIWEGGRWICFFCKARIKLSLEARAARAAKMKKATDPRKRWCAEHDKPLYDEGGGPSPFSVCPDCYEGKPPRGAT